MQEIKQTNTDFIMLIKVAKEKHIDALQKKGHIYCNTKQYFRRIEDDGLRGDKDEGKTYIKQNKNIKIFHKDRLIAKDNKARVIFDNPNEFWNIFCTYGVNSSLNANINKVKVELNFPEKSKEFGDYALLILNPKEFISRIKIKLNSLNMNYKIKPVTYYNPNFYEGKLNPFYKNDLYNYQKEVRLWLPNNSEKVYEFFIGDISNLTYKVPISKIGEIEIEESFK